MLKIEELKAIAELMSENDLTELRLDSEQMQLTLIRNGHNVPVAAQAPVVASVAAPVAPVVAVAAPVVEKPVERKTINSPTIGTYYRSPGPDKPPFVKVGDVVNAETVVCIVEAMKVMNEIRAERAGVIKEALIEDGKPVEFNQPLFVLE